MGREAAQTTVTSLVRDYYATPETWDTTVALDRIIGAQNAWLAGINRRRQPIVGLTILTILTALVLRGQSYTLAHVGDSRAYLLRGGNTLQLTHDHVVNHPDFRHQLLHPAQAHDAQERAMLAPAIPSSTPMASRSLKLLTKKKPNSMATAIRPISTSVAFFRPMYCDSRPSGKRISAPAMIGTDSIRPFCAGLRPKVSEIKGAMAPLSTQMQQENEKYKNAANRVGECPDLRNCLKSSRHGLLESGERQAVSFSTCAWRVYKKSMTALRYCW